MNCALTAAPPLTEELKATVARYVRELVRTGFLPADAVAGRAAEMLMGEAGEAALRREAERLLPRELAAHEADQVDWPTTTDCDRLDAAFAALEASGVVCRRDFSCCGNCGAAEIEGEMDEAAAAGARPVRGYVFYHMQDTETAVEGGGLYLSYGPQWEEGLTETHYESRAKAIAREIVKDLTKSGLRVDWNGELNRRIRVDLDWKRRRPDLVQY